MKRIKKIMRCIVIFMLVAVPSSWILGAALDDAEDLFRRRRLDDAIQVLDGMRHGLSPVESRRASALLARCYWTKASYYTEDPDTRFELYGRGLEAARWALSKFGEDASLYYWQAVLVGERANLRFSIESLKASETIIDLCNKALAIDPSFGDGATYLVLGRLYYKLPGLFGGSANESVRYLLEAKRFVEMKPSAQRAHTVYYFLAESYCALREYDKALDVLEEGLRCPKNPDAPYEDDADYREMEKLHDRLVKTGR